MIDRQMDPHTPQPPRIQVSTGDSGPYILIGHEQLADVVRILAANGYAHNINTTANQSFVVVELDNGANVQAIQELLDRQP